MLTWPQPTKECKQIIHYLNYYAKTRHEKTLKHITYINSLDETIP